MTISTLNATVAKDLTRGNAPLTELKKTTLAQDQVDSAMQKVMSFIHEAVLLRKSKAVAKHEIFDRVVGEPIETLVRRAEIISILKDVGFKCETTETDMKNGTLTITW